MVISKQIIKAIKEYILSDEDYDSIINELKRYKREFIMVLDYNWYSYGNILPYYSQIRDFYEEHGFTPADSDDKLEEHFRQHVRYAIDELLAEAEEKTGK